MVDTHGDVQLFGLHVVRFDWVGVGRRAEQHAGVGFHVERFVEAHQHWPGVTVDTLGASEDEGGAALGLQAKRLGTGQYTDLVGPGTGSVDQYRRAEGATAGLHLPVAVVSTAQVLDLAIAVDLALLAADTAQVTLVQGIGVDIAGAWVVERTVDFVAA
ncbi:hypothetical protein D3C80_690040 [compost metagenome]